MTIGEQSEDNQPIDKLKNEFVFVAAHELRHPATSIRFLLDLVFNDKRLTIDPVLRGYLMNIQEADNRLLQLVEDLLEVSKSETGQLKIAVTRQDIIEHTRTILEELNPSALGKDVNIIHEPALHLPAVMADPNKLREILSNLVGNAIKYNVEGGSVTIEHAVRDGFLQTMVTDTGIGISDGDQKRLFTKFWRSEDVAVRAQSGTGLGLFIVKELVERMGGTIAASSRKGHGSAFSFSLPLAT